MTQNSRLRLGSNAGTLNVVDVIKLKHSMLKVAPDKSVHDPIQGGRKGTGLKTPEGGSNDGSIFA